MYFLLNSLTTIIGVFCQVYPISGAVFKFTQSKPGKLDLKSTVHQTGAGLQISVKLDITFVDKVHSLKHKQMGWDHSVFKNLGCAGAQTDSRWQCHKQTRAWISCPALDPNHLEHPEEQNTGSQGRVLKLAIKFDPQPWPSGFLSGSTAWPDRRLVARCKHRRTAPGSHASSLSSVKERQEQWPRLTRRIYLKDIPGYVKGNKTLHLCELLDNWGFLEIPGSRVLDVLDGHLVSLYRIRTMWGVGLCYVK